MEPARTETTYGPIRHIKADLLPSIVVFLVALPLCMGIAIASGVPVAAGLITGIVGGIVVGSLAGSPLQVSGPAAGLTVIIYAIVKDHGLPALGIAVLLAGAIQLAAGLLKLGQWFRAVSPAVIQGMLAGIGVLIFSSQFHVMVDDAPKDSGIKNLITIPDAIRKGLPLPEIGNHNQRAFRTEKLQQIGMLHERQEEIEEAVAEQVSDRPTDAELVAQAAGLDELIAEQESITGELEALVAQIHERPLFEQSRDKDERLNAAATAALAASRSALARLKGDAADGRLSTIVNERSERFAAVKTAQGESVASLESLLAGLKNHDWAAKLGFVTIAVILLWQWFAPKRARLVPAPLIAVVLATAAAWWLSIPVLYVELPENLAHGIHFPSLTVLEDASLVALLQAALVIAVVASAETLLCATAVDQMHTGPRTNYDRELAAQGVGNMICGFLGALPMTGVVVRSATNVQAGGTSRCSAIMHGLWLLVFVLFLGFLLRQIPTASLAAILVYTGYKLVNPKSIKELRKYGWGEVAIYAATLGTIVVKDLLTGVLVGIALSGVKLLYSFSFLKTRLTTDSAIGRSVLSLEGAATFIRLPLLAAELEKVPRGFDLQVDFQRLSYIDHACLDLLMNWGRQHEASGGRLSIDWDSLHGTYRGTPRVLEANGSTKSSNGRAAVELVGSGRNVAH